MKEFFTNFHQRGNTIYLRYVDEYGNRKYQEIKSHEPRLYVVNHKEKTEFKTIKDEWLNPIDFPDIKEAREYLEEYKDVSGFCIYGNSNWAYDYINQRFPGEDIYYDASKLRIAMWDIETQTEGGGFPKPELAEEELNFQTILIDDVYYAFSVGKYKPKTDFREKLNIDYDIKIVVREFETERQMLAAFMEFWCSDYPDILTGWNIEGFDVEYLWRRYERIFGEQYANRLSPYGRVTIRPDRLTGKNKVNITGIAILDYQVMFKKYVQNKRESYKLDDICFEELGIKKLVWEDQFNTFKEFYHGDFDMFGDYNIIDVALIYLLNKKLDFISLQVSVSYLAKVNYSDVFSPVKTWDNYIRNELYETNVFGVAHYSPQDDNDDSIEGGYVMEPIIGKHKWLGTIDADSLYPNIIVSFNISPETKLEEHEIPDELHEFYKVRCEHPSNKLIELLKQHDLSMTANGIFYRRNIEGILPKLTSKMYGGRKADKNTMLGYEVQLEELEQHITKLRSET